MRNLNILYNDAVYEVKGIASNAFQDCGDLKSIEFHTYSLEEIGSNAFKGCTGLTSIEIPSTVTYIGSKAFEGCTGLTSIEIPASVTSIGGGAFGFCENLISINVSSRNSSYWSSGGLLYENKIGTWLVAVPAGLSPSVILYDIEQHPNLYIDTYAFAGCNKLDSIELPSSTRRLYSSAFYGCRNLKSVTFPSTIYHIDSSAFSDCINLTSFDVYSSPGTSNYSVNSGLLFSEGALALVPPALKSLELPGDYSIASYSIGERAFSSCDSLQSVTIPYKVISINDYAFQNCTMLKSVELPTWGLTTIGKYAFSGCSSLDSINISSSVTSIGDYAFQQCPLKSVTLPSSLEELGYSIFNACDSLTSVIFSPADKSSVNLSSRLFYNCKNLDTVVISNVVSAMDSLAFQECPSLKHVIVLSESKPFLENFSKGMNKMGFTGTLYGLPSVLDSIDVKGANKEYLLDLEYVKRWFYGFDLSFSHVNTSILDIQLGSVGLWQNNKSIMSASLSEDGTYSFYTSRYVSLSPDTEYKIRVNGRLGELAYPLEFSVSTAGVNVDATEITSSSLILCGSYTDGDFTVLQTGFENYNVEGNTLELTGLDPETEYLAQYYVTTEEEGTVSKDFIYKTDTLHLSTLPAKATSNTVALICAETNLSDMETGAGFEWRRYDAPDLVPSTQSPCPVVDGVLTGALRNLSASTYYKFRPYYTSASGQTYYGEWSAFGTADAYVYFDPTVRTYEATGVTETEARVRGYAIAGSDEITEQGFEYWAEDAPAKRSAADVRRVQATGQFMTATLEELQPGTTYTFRVYVETAKGTTYGEEQTFTTVDDGTGIFGVGSDGEAEGLEVAVRGNLSAGETFVKVSGNGGEVRWTLTAVGGAAVAQGRIVGDGSWQRLDGVRASRGIYLLTLSDGRTAKTVKLAAR